MLEACGSRRSRQPPDSATADDHAHCASRAMPAKERWRRADPFAGAQSPRAAGIPSVIAMQFEILMKQQCFAHSDCYRRWRRIETAIAERKRSLRSDHPEWHAVLYMRESMADLRHRGSE